MELLQLMENVVLDLRLDDFWDHPDNRGWAMLFTSFVRSKKFRESWNRTRQTYGIASSISVAGTSASSETTR
jgi:hypothetical protein